MPRPAPCRVAARILGIQRLGLTEVRISFSRPDELQPRVSIPGRWSAHREPIRTEVTSCIPPAPVEFSDLTLVPDSYRLSIPATFAPEEVVIAVCQDGEVTPSRASRTPIENGSGRTGALADATGTSP